MTFKCKKKRALESGVFFDWYGFAIGVFSINTAFLAVYARWDWRAPGCGIVLPESYFYAYASYFDAAVRFSAIPSVGFAQDRFNAGGWLDGLPPLASDATAVYDQFFPKGKKNVYEKYALLLQTEILQLYKESGRKSRLLSMYAGTYDNVDKRVDVSTISLTVDKGLEEKFRECMRLFISAQDEYARADGRGVDSLNKQVYANDLEPSIGKVEQYLMVEKRWFPPLVKKTRFAIEGLSAYMQAKGYK